MEGKYLKVNLQVLWFCGLWNCYQPGSTKSAAYTAFTGAVLAVFVAHLATEFAFVLGTAGDLDLVSAGASVAFTFSTAFLKMALVLRRRRWLTDVAEGLSRGELCPEFAGDAGPESEVLGRADKVAGILSRSYYVMNAIAVGLFFSNVLVDVLSGPALGRDGASPSNFSGPAETAPRALVYLATFPFDVGATRNYVGALTFQFLGPGIFGPAVNIGLDTFIVSLLIHLRGHFRVLKRLLRDLQETADKRTEHVHRSRGFNTDLAGHTPPSSNHQSTVDDAKTVEEVKLVVLKQCIVRHQRIFGLIEKLNTVLSPILFTQFFFSSCTFCLIIFQITLARDSNITLSKYVFFLATALIELLLYCWFGSQLYDESLEVADAIYDCPWYSSSQEFKVDARIMICRSQMPAQLNGLSFYKVNLETYMAMLSASFSYYTVLSQIYSS